MSTPGKTTPTPAFGSPPAAIPAANPAAPPANGGTAISPTAPPNLLEALKTAGSGVRKSTRDLVIQTGRLDQQEADSQRGLYKIVDTLLHADLQARDWPSVAADLEALLCVGGVMLTPADRTAMVDAIETHFELATLTDPTPPPAVAPK